jgi:predicted lipoprotein with Yx(FWY)xxD motif
MDHSRYLGRCIVVGVGALVLSGAGIAAATTPPTEPSDDTTMATADTAIGTADTAMATGDTAMTGAGPSNCPAIAEAPEGTEAPAGTAMTEASAPAASDAPMATEAPTGSEAPTATGDAMATETIPASTGPFVQVAESDEYGPVLVDGQCRTLYAFAQDVDGEPTCVDDCAVNWPPLFTPDESVPALADELDPSLFSVVQHPEGPMLKVGDWPLYYFAADAAPGDTNGQGVGGFWWMVASDGTLLEEAAAPEGSAPADTASMTTGG